MLPARMEEEEALRDEVVVAWEEDTTWRAQLGRPQRCKGGAFRPSHKAGAGMLCWVMGPAQRRGEGLLHGEEAGSRTRMLPDGPEGSLRDAGHPGVTTRGAAGPHPWARRVMNAEETEGPLGHFELETQVDPR